MHFRRQAYQVIQTNSLLCSGLSYTVLCVFCHYFRPLHENVKCCVLAAGKALHFFVAFGRTLGLTHSSVQEILAVFFLGVKRPECSAEAKNSVSDNSCHHFLQTVWRNCRQRSASRCSTLPRVGVQASKLNP